MKRYTSRFLKFVAIFYLAFPVTYLLSVVVLFDIPGRMIGRILLSPTYWIFSLIGTAAGFGLWEMKRWGWYVFLFANIVALYQTAVFATDYGESHHKAFAFVFCAAVVVGLIFRVGREVKVPYFLPKIRWWESDPRYRLVVPVRMVRHDGTQLDGDILDLSMGGCFIKLRTELESDETISLQFTIFGQQVGCSGTVVWRTQSGVTHPKGVGIKFASMTKPQRQVFRAINQRLKEISNLYRTSRYLMSQEEFFKKMEHLRTENLPEPKKRA